MVKGYKTLSIRESVFEKIENVYDQLNPDKSMTAFVSDYLLMNLEKDEFLTQYAPFISKIGIHDNVLTLKDSKKNKYVEIRMKNGMLQSNEDDPIYLQYALALPEIIALKQ